jgi:uncharacterized membrane protein YraQ (UPF0718 family)
MASIFARSVDGKSALSNASAYSFLIGVFGLDFERLGLRLILLGLVFLALSLTLFSMTRLLYGILFNHVIGYGAFVFCDKSRVEVNAFTRVSCPRAY